MTPSAFMRCKSPASLTEVDAICLRLRSWMTEAGPPWVNERFAVELLAREALSNAVRHGCNGDPSKMVSFSCRLGLKRVVIKVEDDGPGFDWRRSIHSAPDDEACHGRGLSIFHLYASRILFNPPGNRVLLIRPLPEPTMSDTPASQDGTKALIHPGDLTASTVDRVRDQLKTLLQCGTRELTVDLAGVQMVDSMGIGLLIQAHNSLAKVGGGLVVRNASADLLNLFRSMRLDKRFTILD